MIVLPARDVVEQICFLMKQDYSALGFLPRMAIEEHWHRGEIVLQWDGRKEIYGYFVHGPVRAGRVLTPKQMYVDTDARRIGLGRMAWLELVAKARKGSATGIRFRCAEGLPSNVFWQAMGCRQMAALENTSRGWRHVQGTGTGKRKRLLFVYEFNLIDTFLHPSDLPKLEGLIKPDGTILSENPKLVNELGRAITSKGIENQGP